MITKSRIEKLERKAELEREKSKNYRYIFRTETELKRAEKLGLTKKGERKIILDF